MIYYTYNKGGYTMKNYEESLDFIMSYCYERLNKVGATTPKGIEVKNILERTKERKNEIKLDKR